MPDTPTKSKPEVPVATIEHDLSPLEDFVERHQRTILWAGIGLLLVVCALIVLKFVGRQAEVKANRAFTAAESVEELKGIASEYSGEVVAGSAQLLLAERLWEEDKQDESFATLKAFVDTQKDHPLYYKGVSDLGLQEHVRGNLERAVELQKQASTSPDAPLFVKQFALTRLGDAYTAQALAAQEAGDSGAAEKYFENARIAYEDLETKAGVASPNSAPFLLELQLDNETISRKGRLPILRVPAEPAPEPAPVSEGADADGEATSGADTGATPLPPPPPTGATVVPPPPTEGDRAGVDESPKPDTTPEVPPETEIPAESERPPTREDAPSSAPDSEPGDAETPDNP